MDRLTVREEDFHELPEPPENLQRISGDPYFEGLDNFVVEVGQHVRCIQSDEGKRMLKFTKKMEELKEKYDNKESKSKTDPEERRDEEDRIRRVYSSGINTLRRRRKEFRKMLKDALDERQKYLDSQIQQNEEQELIRQKLTKLKADFKEQKESGQKTVFDILAALILLFQLGMMLVYQVTIVYTKNPSRPQDQTGGPLRADDFYSYLIHISLLTTFGFGFLLSFIRKFSYSSVGYNLLLVALVSQFAILTNLLFSNISVRSNQWETLDLSIPDIIRALYAAAAVSVSYGAICGKLRFSELIIFGLVETFFYSLNYYLCILKSRAVDPGGAMTIHAFGAYFGLAASFWLSKPFNPYHIQLHETDSSSTYHSNFMTLIGTLFVWCLFPSFNAALAPDGSQYRVTVNTFISMLGGTVMAFTVSSAIRRKKFHIVDIQYASLAGGIAMGSGHAALIVPGGALLVGAVAGFVNVIFFSVFFHWFEKKCPIKFFDTRGVQGLHGISGMIGGFASVIALSRSRSSVYAQPDTAIFPNGLPNQGGFQAASLAISVGVGVGGGFVTGLLIWILRQFDRSPLPPPLQDEFEWHVPTDFPKHTSAGGIAEP